MAEIAHVASFRDAPQSQARVPHGHFAVKHVACGTPTQKQVQQLLRAVPKLYAGEGVMQKSGGHGGKGQW